MLALNRKLAALVRGRMGRLLKPLPLVRPPLPLRPLYRLALEDEKDHRKFMDSFREYHPHAASASVCAKQLAVTWLAKFVTGKAKFELRDLISTKPSVNYAASVAENYGDEIRAAWPSTTFDLTTLSELDYCQLVSPEKYEEAR